MPAHFVGVLNVPESTDTPSDLKVLARSINGIT